MNDRKILGLVSVIGKDQKGVVARVATYLAQHNVNIEDIEQKVVQGLFLMNMLVDLSELSLPLDELIGELIKLGGEMQMEIKVRLLSNRRERTVVVLVSKEPHCLERLLADEQEGKLPGRIAAIFSNHDALRPMAEKANIPFHHFLEPDKAARDQQIVRKLDELKPDLVVLARYMQILTPLFVQRWRSRIINIHPSLLPYHPGANAYKQAFDTGSRVAGCTAHFVTEELDEGPIILQDVFHIAVGADTLDDVKAKGRELESKVLSKAVQLFLNDELLVSDNKVVFKPGADFFKKMHEP
ncbi:formyltetrahydrofolate deformylase [soil metagenome]